MLLEDDRLDAVFHALANRTRRKLLADLAKHPARVNKLARPYGMSVNAISKHLFVLEEAGLIERRREGTIQSCVLHADALADADRWIASYRRFWSDQLDGLAGYVEALGTMDETD
jgi:DNA-binding transcriptional ArsR family regulator